MIISLNWEAFKDHVIYKKKQHDNVNIDDYTDVNKVDLEIAAK